MIFFSTEQCLKLLENASIDSGVKTILEAMLLGSIPTPIGSRLQIWKHPDNEDLTKLEPNDMVSGYATSTRFIKYAKFQWRRLYKLG